MFSSGMRMTRSNLFRAAPSSQPPPCPLPPSLIPVTALINGPMSAAGQITSVCVFKGYRKRSSHIDHSSKNSLMFFVSGRRCRPSTRPVRRHVVSILSSILIMAVPEHPWTVCIASRLWQLLPCAHRHRNAGSHRPAFPIAFALVMITMVLDEF